jgi:hypothetical protein
MNPKLTRKRMSLIAASAAVAIAGSVGAAAAVSGDDGTQDRPIPASDLEQAEKAALETTGEGTVTDTEVDDEQSKYEVEVTLNDGSQVDVQLDETFQVVGTEDEGSDDQPGADDD